MPAPSPILYVPTRDAKVAALRVAHDIGWAWFETVDLSLGRLVKWSDERQDETTHILLGGFGQVRSVRSIHWLTVPGLPNLLARSAQYTLVNSLSHLRAYALKHKPKPLVAPTSVSEQPF